MKKILIAAFVITLALSFVVMQLRPTGQAVSATHDNRRLAEVGEADIISGTILEMNIFCDLEGAEKTI